MAEQTWVSCELSQEPEGEFRRCLLLSKMTAMARGLVTVDTCAACEIPALLQVLPASEAMLAGEKDAWSRLAMCTQEAYAAIKRLKVGN